MSFLASTITLFFVIDAFGIVPTYLSLVQKLPPKEQRTIALRELFFALCIMILFHYVGHLLLSLIGVTQATVQISGGIILFLIAVRMIFASEKSPDTLWGEGKPFIVPIATPLFAGPSVLAVIMIYAQEEPHSLALVGAIFCAWLASAIIVLFAQPIYRLIGKKGLSACEKLMGLIVGIIAVEMFLLGLTRLLS